jgi:hypothetical protein
MIGRLLTLGVLAFAMTVDSKKKSKQSKVDLDVRQVSLPPASFAH